MTVFPAVMTSVTGLQLFYCILLWMPLALTSAGLHSRLMAVFKQESPGHSTSIALAAVISQVQIIVVGDNVQSCDLAFLQTRDACCIASLPLPRVGSALCFCLPNLQAHQACMLGLML